MISIKINGEFIDLNTDTRISLKLKSPIFADGDIIPGSYSIPFTIPLTERNSRILNHPDVLENTTITKKYDAQLLFDHVLFNQGKLNISAPSDTELTANFLYGFQTLSESVKEKTLRDITPAVVPLFTAAFTKTVTLSFQTENKDIGLTINGFTYSQSVLNASDPPTSLISQINAESVQNNCVASNVGGKLQLVPYANPTDITTPFNIKANSYDWIVETNNAAYHATVQAAIIEYYDEGNEPDDIIRFPMFKNTGSYSAAEHDTLEVNCNLTTSIIANVPGGSDTVTGLDFGVDFQALNNNSLCPMVKLSYIMSRIEAFFNITFSGDFIGSNWYNKALLFNTNYIDIPLPYLGDKPFIFYKNAVDVSEHLPDMKVNDFLKALQTRFNLAVYFNEQTKEVVMNYRNAIADNITYIDLTSISSTPKISGFANLDGLLLKSPKDENDQYSFTDELFTGTEQEQEITTKCGHISQYTNTYGGNYNGFQVPIVNKKQEAKDLILVFENYGQTQLAGAGTFMTCDIDEPTDGYSFVSLEDGQWDQYIRFLLNRKLATSTMDLQLRHLLAIDYEKKYRVAGINYLINTIDVTLSMTGIEPAKVTMYST